MVPPPRKGTKKNLHQIIVLDRTPGANLLTNNISSHSFPKSMVRGVTTVQYQNVAVQIYEIISNKTPCYLKDKLPPRNHFLVHIFIDIRCKTNSYSYSFFPDAI